MQIRVGITSWSAFFDRFMFIEGFHVSIILESPLPFACLNSGSVVFTKFGHQAHYVPPPSADRNCFHEEINNLASHLRIRSSLENDGDQTAETTSFHEEPDFRKIRISGYPDVRMTGFPEIRLSRNPDFRFPESRTSGFPDMRISGSSEFRISGFLKSGSLMPA